MAARAPGVRSSAALTAALVCTICLVPRVAKGQGSGAGAAPAKETERRVAAEDEERSSAAASSAGGVPEGGAGNGDQTKSGAPKGEKSRASLSVGGATALGGDAVNDPAAFRFELHGGVAVYYYQPTNGWDPLFFIYSNLKLTARWQNLGIYFEPRLSSEKMRPYYDSLAWMQQGYVFFEQGPLRLEMGKMYKRVGLSWDGSFYGNIQVYEGLKFDPNVGATAEARFGEETGVELSAQYFVLDGHLNASLTGRDTVSIPNARRRNIVVGRVAPFFRLSKSARLDLGISGEAFTADLPAEENAATAAEATENPVQRAAADVKLRVGPFGMWGEYLHQWGANVTAYPLPGDPTASPPVPPQVSADNTYLLAGCEYTFWQLTARYNVSYVRYADVDVTEVLHLPGIGWAFHEHATALFEYAYWDKKTPAGTSQYDRSVNLTLMAYF